MPRQLSISLPRMLAVTASIRGKEIDYCLGMPGSHWIMNSLGVLAAVSAAGADVVKAAAQLAGLKPLKGRGERHEVATPQGRFHLIDDSYNANKIGRASGRERGCQYV